MKDNRLSEIRHKIDALRIDEKTREQLFVAEIDAAQAAIEAAEVEMKKSYNTVNTRGYARAMNDRRRAQDRKNIYNERLSQLRESPLITRAEYVSTAHDVNAAQEAILKAAHLKIVQLIDEAAAIARQAEEEVAEGDACLKTLQVDLYKDPEYLSTIDGLKPFKLKKWRDNTVPRFVEDLKASTFYRNAPGR